MEGRRRKKRAFTLVELLVVIGIIAILMAILVPALGKARKASQEVVCQSNMRQLGLGIELYTQANKGRMPQKGPDGSNAGSNNFGPSGGVKGYDDSSLWFNAIPKMLGKKSYYDMLVDDASGDKALPTPGDSSIFLCPSAGAPGTQPGQDTISGDYFLLNGIDSTGTIAGNKFKFNLSYVYNSKFNDSTAGGSGPSALKITQLRPADLVVTMVEKMAYSGEYTDKNVQAYARQYPTVYGSKINALGLKNNVAQPKSNWKRFTTRHRGGGHLLFADGHVGYFTWPETQIQPDQMPFNKKSDANQYQRMIWSIVGPIQ